MKRTVFFIAFLVLAVVLDAQNFTIKAKSGDAELDVSLDDINTKAKLDLALFKKDLSIEFKIGVSKIEKMLDLQLSPADVFMTFQVANLINKEPDLVMDTYSKNKDKGWGAISKELGIKPGSPEFHALKGKAKNKKEKGGKGKDKSEKGNGGGKGNGKGKNK